MRIAPLFGRRRWPSWKGTGCYCGRWNAHSQAKWQDGRGAVLKPGMGEGGGVAVTSDQERLSCLHGGMFEPPAPEDFWCRWFNYCAGEQPLLVEVVPPERTSPGTSDADILRRVDSSIVLRFGALKRSERSWRSETFRAQPARRGCIPDGSLRSKRFRAPTRNLISNSGGQCDQIVTIRPYS